MLKNILRSIYKTKLFKIKQVLNIFLYQTIAITLIAQIRFPKISNERSISSRTAMFGKLPQT